ncbi:MAG: hypothetical protein H7Y38_06780, partial [Armatimonadetes bacterium]|nr:hypothetical protein [Armatimonadota bacterium]
YCGVFNDDNEAGQYYNAILHDEVSETLGSGRGISGQDVGRGAMDYGYITKNEVDCRAINIDLQVDQINYTAILHHDTPEKFYVREEVAINLNFGGTFNVENSLAAAGYGAARNLSPDIIAEGLRTCKPVPGRFEPVKAGQDFAVLVDYAHTPDGLDNVLKSARPLTTGKLIAVFGCGGDRDKTKRPLMGRIAKTLSDIAIATSDNPRTENPDAILDDVLAGMTDADGSATVYREADRRTAIALAVSLAAPGDTIVIAGKGHETYQIVGTETFPFDDRQVAREEIERAAKGKP